ncbi:MAG: NAD(P)H-hydrate dehydratase [Ignavibacteria bacterium]
MKSVFYNHKVLEIEKDIIESLGLPSIILMENAGKNAALFILDIIRKYSINSVMVLAGRGNNAGDSFVISRFLAINNIATDVMLFYDDIDFKGDCLINYNICKYFSKKHLIRFHKVESESTLRTYFEGRSEKVLIIDGIFGIGFKGELEKRLENVFDYINSLANKIVVAIDTPSGLAHYAECNQMLRADYTVTMGVKKVNSLFEEGKVASGKVVVVDIGIPVEEFEVRNVDRIYELEFTDIGRHIPHRSVISNKYRNGKVFVLAGSRGFTGAAYLCSVSCLRAGAGAVILGIPESLNAILEEKTTEVITFPLPETAAITFSMKTFDVSKEKIDWADVVLTGPGIGREQETMVLVRQLLKQYVDKKFVVDADGLFALKSDLEVLKGRQTKIILTPHHGEFSTLAGLSVQELKRNLVERAREFARQYDVILVLKGSPTIITDGTEVYINPFGRENLATVGSGDVLSGIIAAVYANSSDALGAAIVGVGIHSLCGDYLYELKGQSSTLASDLITVIPLIKKRLIDEKI